MASLKNSCWFSKKPCHTCQYGMDLYWKERNVWFERGNNGINRRIWQVGSI